MTGGDSSIDLRTKLVWLTVFRTVATTLLLGLVAARLFSRPIPAELAPEDSLSFVVIGGVYFLTLVYSLILRTGKPGPGSAYAQVLGDIVLATCVVFLTGGAESPFTFTYSIAVVSGAILLYQRGALIAAACSTLAFTALVVLINSGHLSAPLEGTPLPPGRVVFVLVSQLVAQFLIAALASYLARQVWTTGGRLVEREAALQRLGDLHQQILRHMPSGLISCDRDGKIRFVNRAGANILGVPEGIPELRLDEVIPGALVLGPHVKRAELEVETPAGHRVLGLTASPLEPDGSMLIVFQDLTELRRTAEELKRVDHLAALGRLSAQLAHEIRNPLASMRGSAQLLAAEKFGDQGSARLAQILVREADRLSALVEDFLKFARPPPPALRSFALDELILETVEMLRVDPLAARVRLGTATSPIRALVDPDQVRQVLLNVIRNALAAAGPGGEVKVSLVAGPQGPEIGIWDSAGSIPPSNLGRIFEPFFTTKQGGTGLGLSTAHSIVNAHGGVIRVSSHPAQGTQFLIRLPEHPSEGPKC